MSCSWVGKNCASRDVGRLGEDQPEERGSAWGAYGHQCFVWPQLGCMEQRLTGPGTTGLEFQYKSYILCTSCKRGLVRDTSLWKIWECVAVTIQDSNMFYTDGSPSR